MSFLTRDGAQCPGDARATALPLASMSFRLPSSISFHAPFASMTAVTEAHTSIAFPSEFCTLSKSDCPQLTGVGVRAKRLLGIKNINVYALGLYVDAPAAKKALSKYNGAGATQPLFDAVVGADFERSLRLVISFGALKRGQFLSALDERLAPLMKKAKAEADLQAFKAQFDGVAFHKGLEIGFAAGAKGKLVTKIDGKQVGSIQSSALVQSLFSIYLGPDPVSADAKASFAQALDALLRE